MIKHKKKKCKNCGRPIHGPIYAGFYCSMGCAHDDDATTGGVDEDGDMDQPTGPTGGSTPASSGPVAGGTA